MISTIEFYSLDRVDVGIGASKDVEVVWVSSYKERASNRITLRGHPKPKVVSFELLNGSTVRVVNNSTNVASLWPGEVFLTVTKGHPMYETVGDVADARLGTPMKETTITGTVTNIQTGTDISMLNLSPKVIGLLRTNGYHTVEQLDEAHGEELLSISGIGERTVTRIHSEVLAYMEGDDSDGI